jgi:hypothetical protein
MSTATLTPVATSTWIHRLFSCWNWKCALLSATARSIVYLIAMTRAGSQGKLGVVLVEMAYVTLTAGLYAGIQQMALRMRRQLMGNLIVVVGVPGLSQALDWLVHLATGAPIPHRALWSVCVFALLSASYHLHIMRRGAFLTGKGEHSLLDDFKRIPLLTLGFVLWPFKAMAERMSKRRVQAVQAEAIA